jgi:hypothetical protein
MTDQIYVVDPSTREPMEIKPATFQEIGITERGDLERWVARDPGLLGEPLLVVTSEFSRFEKSKRRVDILALDAKGCLVIVELKLDANRSLADQQAIRYAALCSNMTMEHVVDELAQYEGCSQEEAAQKILSFLGTDDLPVLGNRPRIILASGSMADRELTNCVLWLRGFTVDISCVELTPYRMPDSPHVVVVPRTVIPPPEAHDYRIGVTGERRVRSPKPITKKSARVAFWKAVAHEFNALGAGFRASGRTSGLHMCAKPRFEGIHYEWIVRTQEARLDIALHFEFKLRRESLAWLDLIAPHMRLITAGVDLGFDLVPWGRRWAEARFRLPFEGGFPGTELAPYAAQVMKTLIERTWPVVELRKDRGC